MWLRSISRLSVFPKRIHDSRLGCALPLVGLSALAGPGCQPQLPEPAQPIAKVQQGLDVTLADCLPGSLITALTNANGAGAGPHHITLKGGCTYTLTTQDNFWYGPNGLPAIASDITIDGGAQGAVIERSIATGTPAFRLFYVAGAPTSPQLITPGKLTLKNLTVRGGLAKGGKGGGGGLGAGGAIFAQGDVVLQNVTLNNNQARGGTGGPGGVGSGGGGMGGDTGTNGIMGGGGMKGAGGNSSASGSGAGGEGPLAGAGGGGGAMNAGGAGGVTPGSEDGAAGTTTATGAGGGSRQLGGLGYKAAGAAGDGGSGGYGGGSGGAGGGGGGAGFGGKGGAGMPLGPNAAGGGGGGFGGGGGGGLAIGSGGGGGVGGGGGGGFVGGSGGFGGGGGVGGSGGFGGGGGPNASGGFGAGSGDTSGAGGGAGMGGAVFTMYGTLSAVNSTLTGNTATGGDSSTTAGGLGLGGGIFDLNGTVSLINCTVAGNNVAYGQFVSTKANQNGSAVYVVTVGNDVTGTRAATAALNLENTILADGTAGSTDADKALVANQTVGTVRVTASGANLVESNVELNNAVFAGPSLPKDPMLDTLKDNGGPALTLAELPGSPAIGAGALTICASAPVAGLDARGISRGTQRCDLGAFELRSAGVPGQACTAAQDCASGFCADGVCCNTACGDSDKTDCQSCLASESGGVDGTCSPVAAFKLFTCRAAVAACDRAEICDGTSPQCPSDQLLPAGAACVVTPGATEQAGLCSGTSADCPANSGGGMSGCVTGAGAAPRAAGGTWALAVLFLLTAARRRLRRIPG